MDSSRVYQELQRLLNRKFVLEVLLLLFAFSWALGAVPVFKLCSNAGTPEFTCHQLISKMGLISIILVSLGMFLIIRLLEKGSEQNISEDIRFFFYKIGVYLPKGKKKESILSGAVIAGIAYHIIYPATKVREDLPVGWIKSVDAFSSVVLAPITEEIVYRGMGILGLFNLAVFAYKKFWNLEVRPHEKCILLMVLLVGSSIAFMAGHSNPNTLYNGFIYGILFLARRNILMALAGHTAHNVIAILYEYGVVEPLF